MNGSGEFAWIDMLTGMAGPGSFGFEDDAALMDVKGIDGLVVTHDTIVEGVHFLPDDPFLSTKLLGVNVSDVLAKGAEPFAYLLSMTLPSWWDDERMTEFAYTLERDSERFGVRLMGGDTTRSDGPLVLGVTMFGQPLRRTSDGRPHYVSRLGAQIGDFVAVTGPVGDAAVCTAALTGELEAEGCDVEALFDRHPDEHAFLNLNLARVAPSPSSSIAPLVADYANAAMDVSDGLLGDMRKLAIASGKTISMRVGRVPLSETLGALLKATDDAQLEKILLRIAMTGGDDYVALVTIPPSRWEAALAFATQEAQSTPRFGLFPIGTVDGELLEGVEPLRDDETDLSSWGPLSYQH